MPVGMWHPKTGRLVGGEDAINRKGARHISVSSEKALLNVEPDQGDIVSKSRRSCQRDKLKPGIPEQRCFVSTSF